MPGLVLGTVFVGGIAIRTVHKLSMKFMIIFSNLHGEPLHQIAVYVVCHHTKPLELVQAIAGLRARTQAIGGKRLEIHGHPDGDIPLGVSVRIPVIVECVVVAPGEKKQGYRQQQHIYVFRYCSHRVLNYCL